MDIGLEQIEQQMKSTSWSDGQVANIVHLKNSSGMTASFMDIGATWLSTRLPLNSGYREVLIRPKNMQAHLEQKAYLGAIVGRYGNRIAQGKFTLKDKEYSLTLNNGNNSLHGGVEGFDKRRWSIESQSEQAVCFSLISKDGDQGFPGNLLVKVTYTLTDDNEVSIKYWAECDQDCPVNLTNHAYFNLAGESSVNQGLDHYLMMYSPQYLPTDDEQIPTGKFQDSRATSFDFNTEKQIKTDFLSDPDQALAGGYDHAFIFDADRCDGKQTVAVLSSPTKDIKMSIATTKPAIQFYSGNYLKGSQGVSKVYDKHDGLALETQFLPDGVNHPEWNVGKPVLMVGEVYQHQTVYGFEF